MMWKSLLTSTAALMAATIGHAEIPITLSPIAAPDKAAVGHPAPVTPRSAVKPIRYGPFRVISAHLAALEGATDDMSPRQFAAMLRDYPTVTQLNLIDCPGTVDDRANLALGRLIRLHKIDTHVPTGGSVRSGAVELFLAGLHRSAAADAEFAVHAWVDDFGRSAKDYPSSAPKHRAYLDYYREMGFGEGDARAFYDFTNSAPQHAAIWLNGNEMRKWVRLDSKLPNDLNGVQFAAQ